MTKLITFAGNVLVFFGDWLLSLAFDRQESARTRRVVDAALNQAPRSTDAVLRDLVAESRAADAQASLIGYWERAVSHRSSPCPCEDCARNREMRRRAAN